MAEPNSAKTRPSAIASKAPTPQAIRDCGPPKVAMIAGTVINGPVPTIFDMLIEIAFSNPRRRGMRPWRCAWGAVALAEWLNRIPVRFPLARQDTSIEEFGPALF